MDNIGKGFDFRKEKWGSPSILESKLEVKLVHPVPNPALAYISSLARNCCFFSEFFTSSYLCSSSLINLTFLSTSSLDDYFSMSEPKDAETEMRESTVECPLCYQLFASEEIETHASDCQGPPTQNEETGARSEPGPSTRR